MAKAAQEKLDAKREKEYNKKHKRMYRRSVGDVVFDVLNYIFFTLFTLTCIFRSITCLSIRFQVMIWLKRV